MTSEQIKRCAERCVYAITHCTTTDDEAAVIAHTIAECVKDANQAEDDVRWLRSCIDNAISNNRKVCLDVTTDRLVRILDRLERINNENT